VEDDVVVVVSSPHPQAPQDLVLHVDDGGARVLCGPRRRLTVVVRRAGGGDPSLLSSVPGRPKQAMAEKAGLCRAKGLSSQ
jgi:hypothetical protein